MPSRVLCLIVLAGIGWPGLAWPDAEPATQPDTAALVEGINHFALDLYTRLSPGEENIFFSPYGIDTALLMTYAGARGSTAAEMNSVLHAPPSPDAAAGELIEQLRSMNQDSHFQLHVANALWGQQGFAVLPAFNDLLQKDYRSDLHGIDFADPTAASRTINAWAAQQTAGKIENLISPGVLNVNTRLVLTNAVYFKADWQTQFSHGATRDGPFHVPGQADSIMTPMMRRTGRMMVMENDQFQALEMPYLGGDAAMLILLPRSADGLSKLESALGPKLLADVADGLHEGQVSVLLPKFKLTRQLGLSAPLRAMGIRAAFTPNAADFSGIDASRDLYLSDVVHKAYVSVDEQGTEAAAATGSVMSATALLKPQIRFDADHPFLFMIRAKSSGLLLFVGRLQDPRHQE